tara:strand:- start:1371 stop:1559 length:189 start_codon:yes stop_codon:yes gene_type:complete
MPDISMCEGKHCKLKQHCYRYRAIPNKYRQSFIVLDKESQQDCEYFYDIRDKPKDWYQLNKE